MAVCIVLDRGYCVCQKAKKKDIPFQHGEGRFPECPPEQTAGPVLAAHPPTPMRVGAARFWALTFSVLCDHAASVLEARGEGPEKRFWNLF